MRVNVTGAGNFSENLITNALREERFKRPIEKTFAGGDLVDEVEGVMKTATLDFIPWDFLEPTFRSGQVKQNKHIPALHAVVKSLQRRSNGVSIDSLCQARGIPT
jgi:hypothetical protein